MKASAKEFCEKTPFGPLLEEAYSYKFEEEPAYGKLRHMMKMILIDRGIKPQKNFTFGDSLGQNDDNDIPSDNIAII